MAPVPHTFTLVLDGDLNEAVLDALFEAGCDDATVGQVEGVSYADFVREGPSFEEALRSAIEQVESVLGLSVARLEEGSMPRTTSA